MTQRLLRGFTDWHNPLGVTVLMYVKMFFYNLPLCHLFSFDNPLSCLAYARHAVVPTCCEMAHLYTTIHEAKNDRGYKGKPLVDTLARGLTKGVGWLTLESLIGSSVSQKGKQMYKLTFLNCGKIHQVTSPSFWTLYKLRVTTPSSRLWDKTGALVW